MSIPDRGSEPRELDASDRLDSWKEIAAYLNRSVKTVRRWEAQEGLPVHRLAHQQRGSVFAYRSELDRWWQGRAGILEPAPAEADSQEAITPVPTGGRRWYVAIATFALVGASLLLLTGEMTRTPVARAKSPVIGDEGWRMQPVISPDGRRFSFVRAGKTSWDIELGVFGSRGTKVVAAESTDDEFSPAWSPDGGRIAYIRRERQQGQVRHGLWVATLDKGVSDRVATLNHTLYARLAYLCWSPDGRSVISAHSDDAGPGLFRVPLEGGEPVRLTRPSGGMLEDIAPAMSPDGHRLLFIRRSNQGRIYWTALTANYEALGEPVSVEVGPLNVIHTGWGNSAGEILFASQTNNQQGRLWRVRDNGGDPEHIPIDGVDDVVNFSTDKSRSRLLIASRSVAFRIYKVTGGTPEPFAAGGDSNEAPQVSPDGRRVVWVRRERRQSFLKIAGGQGKAAGQCSLCPPNPAGGRFSADGKRFVLMAQEEGKNSVYVWDLASDRVERVAGLPADAYAPSFSADGKWVYFTAVHRNRPEVWKVASQGGQIERVTTNGGAGALESPDGRFLYYLKPAVMSSIWQMKLDDDTNETKLAADAMISSFAVTGDALYYSSVRRIKRVSLVDGTIRQVVDSQLPIYGLSATADGSTLYYSQMDKQRSMLLLSDLSGLDKMVMASRRRPSN